MSPVEKMAARLLSRHKLSPPFDLESLVRKYGSVEYYYFPFGADGLTVGIGGEGKPRVIINSSSPDTRKRFTLAHELGHIIIPWHTGTIVSHIDSVNADIEYREMEAEANQFAAELLVPTAWLLQVQDRFTTVESLVGEVLDKTGASRDAALIKIFNTIDIPMICVWIESDGKPVKVYRTKTAPTSANVHGHNLLAEEIFVTHQSSELFNLGDRLYRAWVFPSTAIKEYDPRPWRDVLNQILCETGDMDLLPSINAVLPSKYSSNKDKSESELCALALQAYDGREKYKNVVAHHLFPQYVVKRIKELMAKNRR